MKKRIVNSFLLLMIVVVFLCGCNRENVEGKTEQSEKKTEISIEEDEKEPEVQETEERMPQCLEELQAEIENALAGIKSQGSVCAVYVEDIATGDYAISGGSQMQAASLIKLFIAGCIYENVDELVEKGYSGEYIESLVNPMISVSDNDAANTLVTLLGDGNSDTGRERVNQYCINNGYASTHMGRMLLAPNDTDDNYTSVSDCAGFLKKVYSAEIAGAENILSYMEAQQRRGKIPAGVPEGTYVANKTGELGNVENDVAIINTNNHTYILCIMMENLFDTSVARGSIIDISSLVFNVFNE